MKSRVLHQIDSFAGTAHFAKIYIWMILNHFRFNTLIKFIPMFRYKPNNHWFLGDLKRSSMHNSKVKWMLILQSFISKLFLFDFLRCCWCLLLSNSKWNTLYICWKQLKPNSSKSIHSHMERCSSVICSAWGLKKTNQNQTPNQQRTWSWRK